jgi:hypothetical protein
MYMSEDNTKDNNNVENEKTKARDTPKHGSHFSQPPQSKYEDQDKEESKE